MPDSRVKSDQTERKITLLACVENAVRLAREAGASEQEVSESVAWALKTPEAVA